MHSPFRRSASPSFVAGTMCAVGAAAASVPLAAGFPWAQIMIGHPAVVLVIAVLTAAMTYAAVGATLQKSVPMIVVYGTLGGAVVSVLGLMALCLLSIPEANTPSSRDLGLLVIFVLVAGGVGAMLGFVFSLFLAAPVAIAARQIERKTVDGGAYTGIACAVWLAAVAGASLPFPPAVDKWAIGPLSSVVGLIVALIVFARSAWRLLEVRRFIASVRRGEQRGYRIRPLDAGEDLRELNEALFFSSTPTSWAKVAVLEETALDVQAYRGFSPVFRPTALVRAAA